MTQLLLILRRLLCPPNCNPCWQPVLAQLSTFSLSIRWICIPFIPAISTFPIHFKFGLPLPSADFHPKFAVGRKGAAIAGNRSQKSAAFCTYRRPLGRVSLPRHPFPSHFAFRGRHFPPRGELDWRGRPPPPSPHTAKPSISCQFRWHLKAAGMAVGLDGRWWGRKASKKWMAAVWHGCEGGWEGED